MTPKSVSVLAVLTVLSVTAALASLNMKRNYANNGGSGLVFDKLLDKIDQVTKIVVKDNSRETVIIRSPDGVWSLPSSDNYPANVAQVQKSILQLAQLRYLEKKTANKDRYERLNLGEIEDNGSQARRIKLLNSKGQSLADLFVGKNRYNLPGPISEGAYIRKPNEPQTWLAKGEVNFETKLTSWLRNSIINIREENVLEAEIRHPEGEVVRISKINPKDRNFMLHDIPAGKILQYDTDPNNIANVPENLEMLDARKVEKVNFAKDKTVKATFISRSGLEVKLFLVKIKEDEWLKLEVAAKPNFSTSLESGDEPATKVAKRISQSTKGWAFKIPSFKAERLRRGAAEMLIDGKTGS